MSDVRTCALCGGPNGTPKSRFCSRTCYYRDYELRNPGDRHHTREAKRAERLRAQLQKRPRCLICDHPIPYGARGVRLDSRTCGDRSCALRAWKWFGPSQESPAGRV